MTDIPFAVLKRQAFVTSDFLLQNGSVLREVTIAERVRSPSASH